MSAFDRRVDPKAVSIRRVEVITGADRRWRWPAAVKQRILFEALEPGAAVALKLAEDIIDRRTRRECSTREVAPWTTRAKYKEDRVHRRAHVGLPRPGARVRGRDQRFQKRPLGVSQIAGEAFARLPIGRSMFLGPHVESPVDLISAR
jgi:hypothetical protein